MRILYITCANSAGGANIALYNIVKRMKECGQDVMVVTVLQSGPLLRMLDEIGIKYVQMRMKLNVYPKKHNPLLYLPRMLWMLYVNEVARFSLLKLAKSYRPDIIHTNVGPMDIGYRVAKKLGIPHVWHNREYQDLDFGYHYFPSKNTFIKKSHSLGSYNICITKGVFDYHKFRSNVDRVIYDGVFSQSIRENTLSEEKENYVLFAGRIEEAKGVMDLLTVFCQFHSLYPQMSLRLAGVYNESNEYYKACRRYIFENKMEGYVTFLGDRRDIYDLMSHAKMLIVPSRFEGFGFITAEAMVNGCPVVGRDTGGTKEQFDNGLNYTGQEIGYRFITNQEMLNAMESIMGTDTHDMCERARQTALHFYTVELHVQQVLQYYNDILNGCIKC